MTLRIRKKYLKCDTTLLNPFQFDQDMYLLKKSINDITIKIHKKNYFIIRKQSKKLILKILKLIM